MVGPVGAFWPLDMLYIVDYAKRNHLRSSAVSTRCSLGTPRLWLAGAGVPPQPLGATAALLLAKPKSGAGGDPRRDGGRELGAAGSGKAKVLELEKLGVAMKCHETVQSKKLHRLDVLNCRAGFRLGRGINYSFWNSWASA